MLSLFLKYSVLGAAAFALVALSLLVIRTLAFGRMPLKARARGAAGKGIIYAFGQGMMPWAKESASGHLPTFFAGIIYHGAIFISLLYLFFCIFSWTLPRFLLMTVQVIALGGLLAGLGLLVKRLLRPELRAISCPDDFAANLLVNLFLLLSGARARFPVFESIFFLAAIVLFIYLPLGKIRHCFFFFYSRILFGIFFGRRGVLPPAARQEN